MAADLSWLEGLPADVNLDLEEAKQLEEYFSDSDPFSVDEELIQDIDVNKVSPSLRLSLSRRTLCDSLLGAELREDRRCAERPYHP